MEKEDFKWKLGRIFYDLAEGKIGVLDAYERYDAIENEKSVLPQADVSGSSAVNRCNECSKELEGGTVFCSVDCRQHYYH